MRWCANIGLSLVLAATAHGATDVQQGQDAAKTAGTAMRSYAGSGQALSNNLVTPLMHASQITTQDGKTTFTANGFQTSGTPLLLVTMAPYPATGDISIILQQDLTGSGTLGYAQTFPVPGDGPSGQKISGVCQNGYIQCSPNFTNCRYRTWTAGADGAVTAMTASGGQPGTAGSVGGLKGCFCFNNYCTGANNSLLEQANIASDVGGGIITAFLSANTGMAITSATSGSNAAGAAVLTYYGYKPTNLAKGSNTATMTTSEVEAMPVMPAADTQTPQTYYTDSAGLNNAAQNALTAQKAAPNSLYNTVMNSASTQAGTTVTCTNSVQPSLSSVTLQQSQSGTTNFAVDHTLTWTFTETAQNTFVFSSWDNKGYHEPNITYTFQPSTMLGGYTLQSVSLVGSWSNSGGCNGLSISPMWTPGVGIGTQIAGASINGICGASGYQYPVFGWTFTAQFVTQQELDVSNLGCAQYENNSSCTLQQDVWDGRPVVVNGLPMNNKQLGQSCKTLPGVGTLPAVTVCKPWFVQNRSYFCKNTTTYNFSKASANAAIIENSAAMPTTSSMRYTDPVQGGTIVTMGVPSASPLPDCSQVCETKIPITQTGVLYTDTPQSTTQTTSAKTATQYQFLYKDCLDSGSGKFTCPADVTKGEVIVTQCGCSADMSNALGALNAAGSAAQDAICSAN
ncbi:hypothetical protein FO488_00350 [Geobacter sp. FeAm09]|uniref:hypothetical protein n=1 Tax=Geobacter sp. FeAm09 TaxID=2597769 RepID=UPI0011EFCED5|nr:hypothetical protein [Geobacter sp. FeAm09]QEM66757.1 hypothetical protein FO488_00350 [Geobacter sp. FeAm09]